MTIINQSPRADITNAFLLSTRSTVEQPIEAGQARLSYLRCYPIHNSALDVTVALLAVNPLLAEARSNKIIDVIKLSSLVRGLILLKYPRDSDLLLFDQSVHNRQLPPHNNDGRQLMYASASTWTWNVWNSSTQIHYHKESW
jgi:hypothetical protein